MQTRRPSLTGTRQGTSPWRTCTSVLTPEMDRFKPDSEPPLWPMCLLFIRSTFPLMNVAATSAIRAEKGHWKCGKHRCHPNGRMYFGHHPHHPPPLRAGQGGSSRTLALKAGSPQPRWRFNAPKLSARTGRPSPAGSLSLPRPRAAVGGGLGGRRPLPAPAAPAVEKRRLRLAARRGRRRPAPRAAGRASTAETCSKPGTPAAARAPSTAAAAGSDAQSAGPCPLRLAVAPPPPASRVALRPRG